MPNPSARLLLIPFTILFVLYGVQVVTSPAIMNVTLTILSGICVVVLVRQARRDARHKAEEIDSSDPESRDLDRM